MDPSRPVIPPYSVSLFGGGTGSAPPAPTGPSAPQYGAPQQPQMPYPAYMIPGGMGRGQPPVVPMGRRVPGMQPRPVQPQYGQPQYQPQYQPQPQPVAVKPKKKRNRYKDILKDYERQQYATGGASVPVGGSVAAPGRGVAHPPGRKSNPYRDIRRGYEKDEIIRKRVDAATEIQSPIRVGPVPGQPQGGDSLYPSMPTAIPLPRYVGEAKGAESVGGMTFSSYQAQQRGDGKQ